MKTSTAEPVPSSSVALALADALTTDVQVFGTYGLGTKVRNLLASWHHVELSSSNLLAFHDRYRDVLETAEDLLIARSRSNYRK